MADPTDYTHYALQSHEPLSDGPLRLPYQRPPLSCRKFTSPLVEKVIRDIVPRFSDKDLGQLFQNAYPNTLDTTIRWHRSSTAEVGTGKDAKWSGAQSFIVTGDIDAEWIRDSTNQLAPYQQLAKSCDKIKDLVLGAINTQTEFIIEAPYANAFQPPPPSGLAPAPELWHDQVTPKYSPSTVFECKYELDSLANWLALANRYFETTGDTSFLTSRWFDGLATVLALLDAQSKPTFDPQTHRLAGNEYTFSRTATTGTETLSLEGLGNPLAAGTGLVRSAFRPSDDATIFGFLIPSNAMMSVELRRASEMLSAYGAARITLHEAEKNRIAALASDLSQWSDVIRNGVYNFGVVQHRTFGRIFAYEVDGYGSQLLMDDANIPSLLSLPRLGFIDVDDIIYQNTRRFVLSEHNPYFLQGKFFAGVGGPHIGLRNAWPMSVLMQALTSTDDEEIVRCLEMVKKVSVFGLINETIDVDTGVRGRQDREGFTRPWFAWANAVFAELILSLAERRPHLILTDNVAYTPLGGC